MEDKYRVTIKDIAEELGLSTATISNVIHGKTRKISERTVEKVQEKLESSGYIPNMAAVLLAQNASPIVCVVLSDDKKYEGRMLEDPFVSGIVNGLSKELAENGYFMMLKEEQDLSAIIQYASMWNMAGLVLIGYCEADYETLRSRMHIPFVVVDAYHSELHRYSDVGIDNIGGGYLAGEYLLQKGHRKVMYLADNDEDCDHDRYVGLQKAFAEGKASDTDIEFKLVSTKKEERFSQYRELYAGTRNYTAVFCASDLYAIEFMHVLQEMHINVPEDVSIIGFDNIPLASYVAPGLTTIAQDMRMRAKVAVKLLQDLIAGEQEGRCEILPVQLIERESVAEIMERKV